MVLKNNKVGSYFGGLPLSIRTVLLVSIGITVFEWLQQYAYHVTNGFDFKFSWGEVGFKLAIGNGLWVILSPALFKIGKRITTRAIARPLVGVLGIAMVFLLAMLQNAIALWLYNFSYYLQSGYMRVFWGANNASELITGSFTSLIEAVVITGIFLAIDYQKRLANKERDLAKAELDALKMQLHPHFLFNTLHSLSSMIDIDVKKAQSMITKIGDLLRNMLAQKEDEFITLKEEVDFMRIYLELEQIRFQDRMEMTFDVASDVAECRVPSLILQPLVENCIKHGVARSSGNSSIAIVAASFRNGSDTPWLQIEINNTDDAGLKSNDAPGFGIGLRNVEMRLEQFYGTQYFCNFEKLDTHNFKSEIRIPYIND